MRADKLFVAIKFSAVVLHEWRLVGRFRLVVEGAARCEVSLVGGVRPAACRAFEVDLVELSVISWDLGVDSTSHTLRTFV